MNSIPGSASSGNVRGHYHDKLEDEPPECSKEEGEDDDTEETEDEALPSTSREIVVRILRLAWPIVLSNLAYWSSSFYTLWLIGDTGDSSAIAAFGLANGICNVTGHAFLWGIGAGLDTFSTQAWGAKEYKMVGTYGQRALWILTLLVNIPIVIIWLNATPILVALGQDELLASKVTDFARLRMPGLFLQALGCVLLKTLSALGKTQALLVSDILSIAMALLSTWLFVATGSPAAQLIGSAVEGSALAMTVTDGMNALCLTICCLVDSDCKKCWGGWTRRAWSGWRGYLKVALPAMMMGVFEWISWDIVTFLAGLCQDPATTLAANALLGNVIALAYCASQGLQEGAQTLVGNALGAQQPEMAWRFAMVGLIGCGTLMAVQCGALYLAKEQFGVLFKAEPAVMAEFESLLGWTLLFLYADGTKDILSGVITGAGKQALTNPILFVCYWVLGLPLGALSAFVWPHNNLKGLWWGMAGAVWLHLVSYGLICFGNPWIRLAIDWSEAAKEAKCRLEEESAGTAGVPEAPVASADANLPLLIDSDSNASEMGPNSGQCSPPYLAGSINYQAPVS